MPALFHTLPERPLQGSYERHLAPTLLPAASWRARQKRSIRVLDVEAHFCGIDREAFGYFSHRGNGHAGRLHYDRNDGPLRLPASDAALVLLQHRREKRSNQSRHAMRTPRA